MDGAEIIVILSDDEEQPCDEDLSCLIVEEKHDEKPDCLLSQSSLDEDLVVTFCQPAEILPHARYDCPVHPFMCTECEADAPVGSNKLFCDQCFCYICDKLAASCEMWSHSGVCHCNSHKKSKFWNEIRSGSLLGRLKGFNFTLSDVDSHLRRAETMLQSFRQELSTLFSAFLNGKPMLHYNPSQPALYHDYRAVYEFVSSFLDKADKEESRAAAIMNLGAAEDFISHYYLDGMFFFPTFMANPTSAKLTLLQRVVDKVQRLMVTANFTSLFIYKLQDFYKGLPLPYYLKNMRNSLCVRPWDDVLLVTVLKGQNVSGVRKDKGKKDILTEQINVVLLRTEALQHQNRYKDLCRYLRVVKTDDPKRFQQLQQLIPFFTCAAGELFSGAKSLLSTTDSTAIGITPVLFLTYLRIFETAKVPKLIVFQRSELCNPNATWEAIKGAMPLKRIELVKFALLTQRRCFDVFIDSECWTSLLTIVNSPSGSSGALLSPCPQFLHEAWENVTSILNQDGSGFHIPRYFLEHYLDQALLLLVTGALARRIISCLLYPAIPVINTFTENPWASRWLYDNLSSNSERFNAFAQAISQEMESAAGGGPVMGKVDSSHVSSSSKNRL